MPEVKTLELSIDESWGRAARSATRLVVDELTATCELGVVGADLVREVVYDEACRMLSCSLADFFVDTVLPADGATHRVRSTFDADKFREHLAAAAHQDLVARGHAVPPVAGSQVGV